MFQIGDVLGKGWDGFKDNAGVLISAFIIAVVITLVFVVPLVIVTAQAGEELSVVVPLTLIRVLVQTLISALFQMGFITISLKIVRGEQPEIGDLFANFGKLITGFLLSLLLAVVILFGCVILIIPGILLMLVTWLSLWFVVDRNMGVIESIEASFNATSGSIMSLFLFLLVSVVLVIAGSIPCGLGLLIVAPMLSIATAHIYETLTNSENASDTEEGPTTTGLAE